MPINLIAIVLACAIVTAELRAQSVPLVYAVEHTGEDCPAPPLPELQHLPAVSTLPDPFAASDGSGRDTTLAGWRCRRVEILAEIQHYEVGQKPPRPDTLTARFDGDSLYVTLTENGQTLTLSSAVILPAGKGPFPAVIGIGRGTGSLPPELFSKRGVAQIAFDFKQIMSHTQTRGEEPINALYPGQTEMGAYAAWPWGVSRLIDGLELTQETLPIDLRHLGVTGCSFAGKMALFAGAFDERIALTIAQEPGGGGGAAWRVSETLGEVETLGRTSHAWFKESMFQFADAVDRLPFDHHELMALISPRAFLFLGNTDYEWLADESGYVSARAAHEVWKTLGVPDRFGFSINGGHGHCQLPEEQRPEVEAFIEKFLLGDTAVDTDVAIHPFQEVDYARWMEW
ncbi:alpha/beta hydrolase family protein [Neolewinella litorea]|uniref:4-O-methyl-glucuronoyl methylesterase-like domain-containing protein n=1 Tax=Neolewinella litorea TaxID=2562452 RepID=A0A4S4NCT0_9BACT|nr:hypothetical protein [Neolewinella litorea]THH36555.1 hypothetical protein E4021_14910 [Neolewinella litorea]